MTLRGEPTRVKTFDSSYGPAASQDAVIARLPVQARAVAMLVANASDQLCKCNGIPMSAW